MLTSMLNDLEITLLFRTIKKNNNNRKIGIIEKVLLAKTS